MDKGYKIRRWDGKYSSGGYDSIFTKQGKFWKSRRAVMLHLALFNNFRKVYRNCDIVEYSIEISKIEPIESWDAPIEAEARRKEAKRRDDDRLARWRTERELEQYNELKETLEKKGMVLT